MRTTTGMKYWDNIRNYFYRKNLEDRIKGLNVKHDIINLNDAKTIGIVYDSTNPEHDTVIANFAQELRDQHKEVEILGFINDKKPDSKTGVTIFNKKNLSWTLAPQDERVDKFAGKRFDLLLGCFSSPNLPLEFITRISNARWRVGAYVETKTDCFDMMVNVGTNNDLGYLLKQTTYFLNQIKYDSK